MSANNLSANEVIEKHIAAVGGRDVLTKLNSRIFLGRIRTQGLEGKITSIAKAPGKVYQLVDFAGRRQETGFDGVTAWKRDMSGLITILSGEELEQVRENTVFNKLLKPRDTNGSPNVRLLGREQVLGREAYVLEQTLKSGVVTVSYYDAVSFLEIKNVTEMTIKSNRLKREVFCEDHRRVDGVLVPFKLKQLTPVNQAEITISTYKLNAPVQDNIFEPPAR